MIRLSTQLKMLVRRTNDWMDDKGGPRLIRRPKSNAEHHLTIILDQIDICQPIKTCFMDKGNTAALL